MDEDKNNLELTSAEVALEKGDYGQSLALLETLASKYPLTEPNGSKIRMLMVTAYMGKGDEEKAISTCRLLTRCKDQELRQRARQLLLVLEAPSLKRPRNWSIELPTIQVTTFTSNKPLKGARKSTGESSNKLPRTGPTNSFSPGFLITTILLLIGLTILLSGYIYIA